MRSTLAGLTAAACIAAVGTACSAGANTTGPTPGPLHVVSAYPSLTFSPAELTITAGDSVVWAFGGIPHTVVFQRGGDSSGSYGGRWSDRGAPADVGSMTNGSATRVFTTRGSFNYRCTLHPGMIGEVRVQ